MTKELNEKTKDHVRGFFKEFSELLDKYHAELDVVVDHSWTGSTATLELDFMIPFKKYEEGLQSITGIDLGTFIDKDIKLDEKDLKGF